MATSYPANYNPSYPKEAVIAALSSKKKKTPLPGGSPIRQLLETAIIIFSQALLNNCSTTRCDYFKHKLNLIHLYSLCNPSSCRLRQTLSHTQNKSGCSTVCTAATWDTISSCLLSVSLVASLVLKIQPLHYHQPPTPLPQLPLLLSSLPVCSAHIVFLNFSV